MTTLRTLHGHQIVPVIVIHDAANARDLAMALLGGGITCAEVTLRTDAALEAIELMASVPDFTVGVGTVITELQLRKSRDAGATFAVMPGIDTALVSLCLDFGLGVLPGIATASEAMLAVRMGLDAVKFFPADRLGGLATIRALAAPLPQLGFVPSGGVTAESAAQYLADPAVPAVSGSWMAPADLIAAADFDEILRRSAAAVAVL
jgi:2-dehydro-3-deoxyphosphogluconate aldolase / (4S)-4-hydroxy-2-oxoglutarate aldolase